MPDAQGQTVLTSVGGEFQDTVPTPASPWKFVPQQKSFPSVFTAHPWLASKLLEVLKSARRPGQRAATIPAPTSSADASKLGAASREQSR